MSASGVTSTKQVVIDLKLLSGDATKNIQDLNVKIGNLKAVLKGMKDAGLENTEQYIKLSQVLKEMNQTVKQNEKVLIANINEQKANGDSLNAMRARLKTLRAEYEDLSRVAREGDFGKNLLNDINNLTTEIKQAEFAQQDFSRQVGEYQVVSQPARTALREMRLECQNLAVALQATQGKIQAQNTVVQQLANTVGTSNKEYEEAVNELNRLNKEYSETQAQLSEMEKKTGELADTIDDSNKRIASFANDEQKIAAMQEGVNVLTSAFTLLQGSLKALGVETKSLLEVYARIQIVQQSVNSLMTIYKALNKDSNLMITAKIKLEQLRLVWTNAYNAALAKQNGEVAANTVAETANTTAVVANTAAEAAATPVTFSLTAAFAALNAVIKANPIVFIASAILVAGGVIVGVIKKITKANREEAEAAKKAKEAEEERIKVAKERISEQAKAITAVTGKYEEEIAKIRTLIRVSESETASYKAKKAAIDELNRIVPQFNGAIDQTGRLIRGNTAALEDYINTLYQKANAEAYYNILVDSYKQMAQLQNEFNIAVAELGRLQEQVEPSLWKTNAAIVEQSKLVGDLQKQLTDYQQTVWQVEEGAASAVAAGAFTTTPKTSGGGSTTPSKDKEDNGVERARKMYEELQETARNYYKFIEHLSDDALQEVIANENSRYEKELEGLLTAYNNALDLTLMDEKTLADAGIDKEALKRYVGELSAAMDEAARRNQANIEKIKQDHQRALDEMLKKTNQSYEELVTKLRNELERDGKTEVELIKIDLAQRLEALNKEEQAELEAHEYTEAQKLEITRLYQEKREMLARNAAKQEQVAWAQSTSRVLGAMQQTTSAFSDLFGVLAENDEKYQKYANALGLVDIMTNMAVGIAEAVSAGAGMPFPYNLAAIAAGIAAVVSGIASAIALFKKNDKVGSAPKFSHGGLVGNKTTRRRDDTVDAKLTLGEYVVSAPVVDKLGVDFFNSLNFGKKGKKLPKFGNFETPHFATGGLVNVPNTQNIMQNFEFDYDMLREVVSDALNDMPAPVVSVKEITTTQNRVKTKENLSRQ